MQRLAREVMSQEVGVAPDVCIATEVSVSAEVRMLMEMTSLTFDLNPLQYSLSLTGSKAYVLVSSD